MFCPHCHNKIPDGSNFCPLCYANLVGVKQQEKESAAETDAPRPKQKPAPRKNNAKPAYTKGSRQGKRAQDKTPMIIAIGLILILVLTIICKILLDLYMQTKSGYLLRAVGDNHVLVTSLAKDQGNVKILGLAISNGLVSLAGCVFAQEERVFEISMGTGHWTC